MNYLTTYFHTFITHLGCWTTFHAIMLIKDNKEIRMKKLLQTSVILSLISGLSHNHWVQYLK